MAVAISILPVAVLLLCRYVFAAGECRVSRTYVISVRSQSVSAMHSAGCGVLCSNKHLSDRCN